MYVTRRLSELRSSPDALAVPPEGPNSGFLVIQDEELETSSCLQELPFPQNKLLSVELGIADQPPRTFRDRIFLIPALNHPLSSNCYYAIVPAGNAIGNAWTCSREEDKVTCCFCRCINDVQSRPLDPGNVYQQIKLVRYQPLCNREYNFAARSVAPDGFPPLFLRRRGWRIYSSTVGTCKLDKAEGIDYELRVRLPEFNFLSRRRSESSIVGKWYCPFMFVKEGRLRDRVQKSVYYQITLEQRWERIFACKQGNSDHRSSSVAIDTLIEKEEAFINKVKAYWKKRDEVVWFRARGEEQKSVGLREEVVQRMEWELERFGYSSGGEGRVKINRVEECGEFGEWSEFGCYVLVERFNLQRMDGSSVLYYDFKHLDKMKTKWL